jgi:hypothetical protein
MYRPFNRRAFLRLATLAAAAPIFDVKLLRGLDFTLLNSPKPQKYLIETMPGGVALCDYNNDGRPDILVTELLREIYGLYHNDGGRLFTNQSLETGLGALTAGSSGWKIWTTVIGRICL